MGLIELKFCFKFLKGACMAVDEDGNPAEAFLCITTDVNEEIPVELHKEGLEQLKVALAAQVGINADNIVTITEEEYEAATHDEDGNQKENVLCGKVDVLKPEDGPLGEFNSIIHLLPVEVREDVESRINDWLSSGGKDTDRYIINQVEYAKRVAKMMEERANECIPEEGETETKEV